MTYGNEDSPGASMRPCVDWSTLDGMAALQRPGAPDLRVRLLDLFLNTTPELMNEIRLSVGTEDGTKLARAAHSLKSSCFNLGATGLGKVCAELERTGKAGDLRQAEELLVQADEQFAAVKAAFEEALLKFRA